MSYARNRLKELMTEKAVHFGKFTLACGETSDLLIDCSSVLRTWNGYNQLKEAIDDMNIPRMFTKVGGPLTGSDLISPAFASLYAVDWFGIRKEPKNRGLDSGLVSGNLESTDEVLLVEDVCTSGVSLLRAAEECKCKITGVFAVVDRGGLRKVANLLSVPLYKLFDESDFR